MSNSKFLDKLQDFSARLAANRYVGAIRDGMSATIPLIIIGSIFVLVMNFPIEGWQTFIDPYRDNLSLISTFTSDFMAMFVIVGIATSLSRYYDLDSVSSVSLSIAAFLISTVKIVQISPESADLIGLQVSGNLITMASFGATGLFTAMLTTIFSVEVLHLFNGTKFEIKMPGSVPPSVARSFAVIFPFFVAIAVLWIIRVVFNIDINELIRNLFSPLNVFVGNNLGAVIIPILIISIFWLLGIHGMVIVTPILTPLWYEQLQGNAMALTAGISSTQVPNIVPEQFFQYFVWIGGAGATLGLVLVMLFFGKSKFMKQFSKITLIPSIFNINEPVMFGLPIIMNPIFAIPFILAPLVTGTLTYVLMSMHLVGRAVAVVPWTLPAPIGAFLSTNFNVAALLLSLVNILISMVIYYPFVRVMDKKMLLEEAAEEKEHNKGIVR